MSFILTENLQVYWPVIINTPADGGKVKQHKIELRFIVGSTDETEDFLNRLQGIARDIDEAAAAAKVRALWADKITGWKHVMGAKKTALPFNSSNLENLLKLPFVIAAIFPAYTECCQGIEAKN